MTKAWKEVKKGSSPVGGWRELIPGRETSKGNGLEVGGIWCIGETVGKPGGEEKDNMCQMSDMYVVLLIPSVDLYGP